MENILYGSIAFVIGLFGSFLAIYTSIKIYAIRKKKPLSRWNSWVSASSVRLFTLLGGYILIAYIGRKFDVKSQTNELMLWVFTGVILVSIVAHIKIIRSKMAEETSSPISRSRIKNV